MQASQSNGFNERLITDHFLNYLLYKLSAQAAVPQFDNWLGRADVFSVNSNSYGHEYEIKVSKSDLMSELKSIDELKKLRDPEYLPTEWAKQWKHAVYLGLTESKYASHKVPNYFSFIVPRELVEVALPILEDTPYGLVCVAKGYLYGLPVFSNVRKAKLIKKDKLGLDVMFDLTRRLSYALETERKKTAKNKDGQIW